MLIFFYRVCVNKTGLDSWNKVNRPHVGHGPTGEEPSVWGGEFYGILTSIYESFGENLGNHKTAIATSATGD